MGQQPTTLDDNTPIKEGDHFQCNFIGVDMTIVLQDKLLVVMDNLTGAIHQLSDVIATLNDINTMKKRLQL